MVFARLVAKADTAVAKTPGPTKSHTVADPRPRDAARLITLEDAGLQPWLTLHDEIVIECETADAAHVADLMRRTMSHNPHPALGVPIHVKGGILGTGWGKP